MYSALTDQSGDSISWQPMTKLLLSISLAIQILPSPAQSQIGIMRTQIRKTTMKFKIASNDPEICEYFNYKLL